MCVDWAATQSSGIVRTWWSSNAILEETNPLACHAGRKRSRRGLADYKSNVTELFLGGQFNLHGLTDPTNFDVPTKDKLVHADLPLFKRQNNTITQQEKKKNHCATPHVLTVCSFSINMRKKRKKIAKRSQLPE